MKRKEVIDFLNEIESNYPINEWKIDNICIWPYIRINIAFGNLDEYISADPVDSSTEPSNFIEEPFLHLFKTLRLKKFAVQLYNLIRDANRRKKEKRALDQFINTCSKQKNKILCFSLSHFRTTVNNKMYNRFMDPLLFHFSNIEKVKCFELDYNIFHENKKKHNENLHLRIEPLLHTYLYHNGHNYSINENQIKLKDYTSFLEFLRKNTVDTFDISQLEIKNLAQTFQRFFTIKDFFKLILEKNNCKLVFITPYYGFDFFALCSACHDLKIKCVDIQHGISDEFHFSYGNWKNVPYWGYEMLPDYFWTWSESEAKIINRWADGTKRHQAFAGGNPWLQSWENNKLLFKKESDIFNQLKKKIGDRKIILYSLESRLDYINIIPDFMLEVLKKSPENLYWLIRMHPNQLNKKADFTEYLKNQNLNVGNEIEIATYVPLPILLSNTHLHTTLTSSVTLEAAIFGINTILTDANSLVIYEQELESKVAVFADNNPSDILKAIENQLSNEKEQKNNLSSITLKDTIDKLMNKIVTTEETLCQSR